MTSFSRTAPTLLALAVLGALSLPATAAPMRYQGQLSDGGVPANGYYDLQVSLHGAAKAGAMLQLPTTFEDVAVLDGVFEVELDVTPGLADAWLQAAVRDGDSVGAFSALNAREKVVLAPQAGTCWSTVGDTGTNPAVNFLGNTDNKTLVLSSPGGVSVNKRAQIVSGTADLLVGARTDGDDDADVRLQSRSGKEAAAYVRDGSGSMVLISDNAGIEFYDGLSPATQNAGAPVFDFSGRLRSQAAGPGVTDASGGLWLGDEVPNRAYVGRGSNDQNWTGVQADGLWRLAVHDDGLLVVNGTTNAPGLQGTDMLLVARPGPGGDSDTDFVWQTRSGRLGRIYLGDANGGFYWHAFNLAPGADFLTMNNGAKLSNGGTWVNASSRALKEGFAQVDVRGVLDKVVALPVTLWNYRTSAEGTHLGPVAEDFKAAFGLAGDGKSISTVDADGVALAAIQGLNAKLEEENASLRARLDAIERRLGTATTP